MFLDNAGTGLCGYEGEKGDVRFFAVCRECFFDYLEVAFARFCKCKDYF